MTTPTAGGLILPSNPEDRQKIKVAIKEISNSKTRIEAENDNIKAIVAVLSDEQQIPKPAINKIAAWYHKQSLGEDVSKLEDAQDLYETVFGAGEEE